MQIISLQEKLEATGAKKAKEEVDKLQAHVQEILKGLSHQKFARAYLDELSKDSSVYQTLPLFYKVLLEFITPKFQQAEIDSFLEDLATLKEHLE